MVLLYLRSSLAALEFCVTAPWAEPSLEVSREGSAHGVPCSLRIRVMFDTHCHLFDAPLSPAETAPRMASAGLHGAACVATYHHMWEAIVAQRASVRGLFPGAVFALGAHPWFIEDLPEGWVSKLEELLPLVEAVGEIGLDRGNRAPPLKAQLGPFEQQMALARSFNKPALLHVVKAHELVLAHLKEHPGSRGIIHAFSGSPADARSYIDKGWYLGIGGGIARENAHRLRRIVKGLPLTSLVLETDAPYMGTPNCAPGSSWPGEVKAIGEHLATILEVSAEEVFAVTTHTAKEIFSC